MRNFIVIGSGRGILLQVLLAVHSFTDAACIVVSSRKSRALRFSRLCAEYVEFDLFGGDDDRFVDFVNRCAERMPSLTLIPADCDGARIADRVCERIMASVAPYPTAAMIDCFDDKWCFYQFCKKHGLAVPPTCYIGDKSAMDFDSIARELGAPFVVKPTNQAGGVGVSVIHDEHDCRRRILDNDRYRHGPLIAQAYVDGTDVGLNLLAVDGKVTALAMQERKYPQHEAARIRFFANQQLEDAAHMIAAESHYCGVMNVDARMEKETGNIYLIESNPRYWRSHIASVWCGLNFVAASLSPAQPRNVMRRLSSGNANVFYHPIFIPALWPRVMFDRHGQGRTARLMMFDICTLGASTLALLTASTRRPPPRAPYRAAPYRSAKI